VPSVSRSPVDPTLFDPIPRPSFRHRLLVRALPVVRRSGDLTDPEAERRRVLARRRAEPAGLPTWAVPGFTRRFAVERDDSAGFPSWVVTPRARAAGTSPGLTVLYLHGGGYAFGLDPFHLRWVCRLARATGARIVLPDYPLAPEHTWRDSHEALVGLAGRYAVQAAEGGGELVLAGDSAGGGYALSLAQAMRDTGGPRAARTVLISPWVDLAGTTPEETAQATAGDPWLFVGKIDAYAGWWAGSEADLRRPEVSPGLGSLADLPPTLLLGGTRDTLLPGFRLLVRRAAEAGWELTSVEEPGLLHVYPLLPLVPEADRAFRQVLAFLAR